MITKLSLVFPVSVSFVVALASAAYAADAGAKCESGKLKEAAKYGSCRLKADSKSVKTGDPADYTKCESKFTLKWTSIESKAGPGVCPSQGDVGALDDRITLHAVDVATVLAGGNVPFCGDSVREGVEQCDGTDLDSQTCMSLGYLSGTLACTAGCSFNFSGCMPYPPPSTCGDGVIDVGEDCDLLPAGVGSENCSSQGQGDAGELRCGANCSFDYGKCSAVSGCADGEREGFVDQTTHPDIAGCSGGWSVAGTLTTARAGCVGAGDDSANPTGSGCSAADLCAPGWHLCETPADVAASSPDGCASATQGGDPDLFFVQRQSSDGYSTCDPLGANDLFGCGNVGYGAPICGVLNRSSDDFCAALPSSWDCGVNNVDEANQVVKTAASDGGALCCRGTDAKIVFMANTYVDGALGVAGYDAQCAFDASSNGLPGTYKAWISTTTAGPATTFTHGTGQYVRTDGVVVAQSWADLTDGSLAAPIDRNAAGFPVGPAYVWSNTAADGTPANLAANSSSDNCVDWTSFFALGAVGSTADYTDSRWTSLPYGSGGQVFCSDFLGYSVYCFQQ